MNGSLLVKNGYLMMQALEWKVKSKGISIYEDDPEAVSSSQISYVEMIILKHLIDAFLMTCKLVCWMYDKYSCFEFLLISLLLVVTLTFDRQGGS